MSIHYGSFLSSTVSMAVAPPGRGFATVLKTEEKGSDVNLATHLLVDAYEGDFEVAAVVSNDSDLVEPIRMVREKLGLEVGVLYPPTRTPSSELGQVASFRRKIRQRALRFSQFPDSLADGQGTITKPQAGESANRTTFSVAAALGLSWLGGAGPGGEPG